MSATLSRFRLSILALCLLLIGSAAFSFPAHASGYTATQETYFRTVLAPHIGEAFDTPCGVITAQTNQVVTEVDTSICYVVTIQIDDFLLLYGDAIPDTAPPTSGPAPIYDALMTIDQSSQWGTYGYANTFAWWKSEGLIN